MPTPTPTELARAKKLLLNKAAATNLVAVIPSTVIAALEGSGWLNTDGTISTAALATLPATPTWAQLVALPGSA